MDVDTGNLQVQNRVFFVPKFVRKFGDKKYPIFKKQRQFTEEFEKWQKKRTQIIQVLGQKIPEL